jgi:pyrroline-5-carboxylate reductase
MTTPVATGLGRIAFIGGGFMGEAIIQGLLSRRVSQPHELTVCDIVEVRREQLRVRHGVRATAGALDALDGACIVVLAVKPQEFTALAPELAGQLAPEQVVVSIMAGVRIEAMQKALGHLRLVRAMPNTPGSIGQGFTGWTATEAVDASQREAVAQVLGALGATAYLAEEKYLDMVTAVSGSGPGYVLLFIEAMIDAAVHIGLRRDLATEMVLATVGGTVQWAQVSGQHPAQLRNAVTSPAGTTAAGLLELERAGLRTAVVDGVVAAFEKSRVLGG